MTPADLPAGFEATVTDRPVRWHIATVRRAYALCGKGIERALAPGDQPPLRPCTVCVARLEAVTR